MENKTEFDLTKALAEWRLRAGEAPALSTQDLRELESHLKDSIAKLQKCGLSLEESFQIATRRLGSIETLGAEFGKVNAERVWLERALWIVGGLQVYFLVSSITRLAVGIILDIGQSLWLKVISREMAYSDSRQPIQRCRTADRILDSFRDSHLALVEINITTRPGYFSLDNTRQPASLAFGWRPHSGRIAFELGRSDRTPLRSQTLLDR